MRARTLAVFFPLLALGCAEHQFKQPVTLGGKVVTAEELNRGHDAYQQYCRPCHGENGDGRGYSSLGLRPPPRDFTQALFKFGGVAIPGLPPDSELKRIVNNGLHGTAMLPWDVSDKELEAILQYIKTFSPKWLTEAPGQVVAISSDPYGPPKAAQAIELGRKLYHAKAQCSNCHPAYVTHRELFEITKEMAKLGNLPPPDTMEFSEQMYSPPAKPSDYCLEWKPGWKKLEDRECLKPVSFAPPDFTRDPIRAGTTPRDLYRTVAAGIGGAGMPTWKGALAEDELWALVYYVHSLIELNGTPAARKLRVRLFDPANLAWAPPAAK